jgi:hypothetical protein
MNTGTCSVSRDDNKGSSRNALTVKLATFGSTYLEGDALVPIRPFLNGETFDPETARLVGIAFETTRAAVNRPADLLTPSSTAGDRGARSSTPRL